MQVCTSKKKKKTRKKHVYEQSYTHFRLCGCQKWPSELENGWWGVENEQWGSRMHARV